MCVSGVGGFGFVGVVVGNGDCDIGDLGFSFVFNVIDVFGLICLLFLF